MFGIFDGQIKRRIVLLVFIFFVALVVVIGIKSYLGYVTEKFDARLHNQVAKEVLGNVLVKKLYFIEIEIMKLVYTDDKRIVENTKKRIDASITDMKEILKILRDGGEFEEVLKINIGKVEYGQTTDERHHKIVFKKWEDTLERRVVQIEVGSALSNIKDCVEEIIDDVLKKVEAKSAIEKQRFEKKIFF